MLLLVLRLRKLYICWQLRNASVAQRSLGGFRTKTGKAQQGLCLVGQAIALFVALNHPQIGCMHRRGQMSYCVRAPTCAERAYSAAVHGCELAGCPSITLMDIYAR